MIIGRHPAAPIQIVLIAASLEKPATFAISGQTGETGDRWRQLKVEAGVLGLMPLLEFTLVDFRRVGDVDGRPSGSALWKIILANIVLVGRQRRGSIALACRKSVGQVPQPRDLPGQRRRHRPAHHILRRDRPAAGRALPKNWSAGALACCGSASSWWPRKEGEGRHQGAMRNLWGRDLDHCRGRRR